MQATAAQAALSERERIAEELHDGLAKGVAGLSLGLQALQERAAPYPDLAPEVCFLAALSRELVRQARDTLRVVRRPLGTASLADDLRRDLLAFSAQTGIAVHASVPEALPHVEADCAAELQAVVAECLENVRRHAAASQVSLAVTVADGWLVVREGDNGRGMQSSWCWSHLAEEGHYGLLGTRERVRRLGGALEVCGRGPWGGVCVTVRVPVGSPETSRRVQTPPGGGRG